MRCGCVIILREQRNRCNATCCGTLRATIAALPEGFRVEECVISRFASTVPPSVLILACPVDRFRAVTECLSGRFAGIPTLGIVCSSIDESMGGAAFPEGVVDFIVCPFSAEEVAFRIRRLLQKHNAKAVDTSAANLEVSGNTLIGRNAAFRKAVTRIALIARTNAPALLLGETGTGKELFARAIHYQSQRSGGPFIALNCGAVPDHLFENELFGHSKGAFTDASSNEKGLLAEAEGGTFFLDEIDSLSPAAQIKVLRFLQEKEYRPLGTTRAIRADVRLVAATNSDLQALRRDRLFREDLYHRLNVVSIIIPPLRDRLDDIPDLVRYFIARHINESRFGYAELSPQAMRKLIRHHWSGNVRELERVVQRALILAPSAILQPEDFELSEGRDGSSQEDESFQSAKKRVIGNFEQSYLCTLLAVHGGNVTQPPGPPEKNGARFSGY